MNACNLLPRTRREKRRVGTLQRRWGVAVGVYALATLATCAYFTVMNGPKPASASSGAIQSLDREQDQIRRELGQLKMQLVADRRQLDRSRMIAAHPDFSPLLGVLARERRRDVVLESCSLKAGSYTTASNPMDRRPQEYVLTVSGFAREAKGISAYAGALEATKAFDSVTIQGIRGRGGLAQEKTVGFTLRCMLREAAAAGGKP